MRATRIGYWLLWICALLALVGLLVPLAAHAETLPVRLSVQRIKGADLLGRVAGTFRLTVDPGGEVRAVVFYLDGQPVGRATSYPFSFEFDTGSFPKGEHQLQAVAHFADGAVATSNRISLEFRSRHWLLALRQSLFLYAAVVLALGVVGALGVRHLLHIQPRLILLDR